MDKERLQLSTDVAMFLAARLKGAGIDVHVVSRDEARRVYYRVHGGGDGLEEFSVGDIQRLNYVWNGEEVSLRAFASAFMNDIKQKDRTLEDANRIATEYIKRVAEDPSRHVPALVAENMSHARYFILNDGSVFTREHPMWNSPEYETQRGLYEIYSRVLGDSTDEYFRLLDPSKLRSEEENTRFVAMEREVNGSSLMQGMLENNAEKVTQERIRAVKNLIQYFDGNDDYLPVEKALLLKGAMTWGVVEKKLDNLGKTEVRIVKLTDANDIAVPVIGGEAASVVEGLRHGMNFKDALREARERVMEVSVRSVPRSFTGWKRYVKSDREEEAVILNKDVAGTGWCTGGALSTARSHLSGGDFHVYFEGGEPLIAIRTEDGRMAEPPRGAHDGQFCTDREEQIAFDYVRDPKSGIEAGEDYVNDILDIRRIMSPEATWKDAIMMPDRRRYENGEFGGDTLSWGESVEKRKKELLDSVSVEERHEEGYYYSEEIIPRVFETDRYDDVRFIIGSLFISEDYGLEFRFLESIDGCLTVDGVLDAPALQSVGLSLDVHENARLDAPALQSVGGSLFVYKNACLDACALQSVGRSLDVHENSRLNVPVLQSVGSFLAVHENARLNVPVLQSVGGYLDVYVNARLDAPALQSVGGSFLVYKNACLDVPALQSVGGSFDVLENVQLDVPALQSVGGGLLVSKNARLDACALQSVGRSLNVRQNVQLDVPALQSVGGYLYVHKNARLNAPVLQSVGGELYVDQADSLDAPALQYVDGLRFSQFSYKDGSVYGYAIGDSIYLTPKGISPETPIHEYTHLWAKVLELKRPEAWKAVVESLKATPEWKEVSSNGDYSHLKDENRIASEVLSLQTGRLGARLLDDASGKAVAEGKGFVEDAVKYFQKEIYDRMLPLIFGTVLMKIPERISLLALKDFCEGKRNSLAEYNLSYVGNVARSLVLNDKNRLSCNEDISYVFHLK